MNMSASSMLTFLVDTHDSGLASVLVITTHSMTPPHLAQPHAHNAGVPTALRCRSSESQAALENALMTSKMDALALEFNHLLVSQLDSQRHYYEGAPGH